MHLLKPLGFELDDKKLRRAGLDYPEWVAVQEHDSLADFMLSINPGRIFALTTKGNTCYSEVSFQSQNAFLFGPETRGLPATVLAGAVSVLTHAGSQPESQFVEYRLYCLV